MSNTFIPKLLSVFVVLVMTLVVAIPVIETINTSGHTDPSIQVYGYTSLDAYTDTLKSEKGNISGLYASMRGDISGDAFIESVDGDYLAYPLGMALGIPDQLIGQGQFIGVGESLSDLTLGTYTANTASTLIADGITLTLTPYDDNYYFATVGVSATATSGYVVVPYQPTAPIATYGNNSIHSLVLTDTVGNMSGTTFTPAAGGSWLMIPMHILRDSVKDYMVKQGDTFYAPDANGDLAAFTASAAGVVSGTNSGVSITLTRYTPLIDATVYLLTATVTDMDLPGVVIPVTMSVTMPAPQNIEFVTTNNYTSYCIDSNGALWVTGSASDGQYGNGMTDSSRIWVKSVASGVTAVAVDNNASAIYLDDDGAIWASGANNHGEFGNGTTTGSTTWTKVVNSGAKAVAAGSFHFLYMDDDGALWVAGENEDGQLGDGSYDDVLTWTKVVNSGVKAIAAGHRCSFYIDNDGALWATGSNSGGQLGLGADVETIDTWTKVVNSGVKEIVSGNSTSYYISTSGALYATGSNSYGLFGNNTQTTVKVWTEVVSSGVSTAALGGLSVGYYVDTSGALYATGRNNNAQFGTGSTSNTVTKVWTKVVNSGVVSVASGGDTSFYINTSDKLYATGQNYGRQGDGNYAIQKSWHEAKASTPTFSYTNPTETETVSDLRGTVSSNVFTPDVHGDYLYIPIEDATTYTYYVAVGSTVYAPDTLGTALAPHVVPDVTGIDPAVTLTLTLESGYEDQIYAVTATTTDTDIVGWAIPYTVTYQSSTEVTTLTENYTGSYGYAFTPDPAGTYIRVPLQVGYDYEYYADMGSTYYYTGDDGTLQTDTVDTPIYCDEYTVMFDAVEYPTFVLLPDITGDLTGEECFIIPVEYGEGQQNVVHESGSYNYEPLLGDMIQGEFVEDDHGAWVLLYPANLMESEVTYYLGTVHSYYFGGLSDLVQYTAPATPQEGLAITLTATETNDVSVLTVTEMDPDSVMLIPYKINYTVPGEPVKMLPFLDIIPLALVILAIVVVAALVYDRKTGGL